MLDAFAWGLETSGATESPTKRRRTTTLRYIEQDLQQAVGTPTKPKDLTRLSRTRTWPSGFSSDASGPSRQLSQDTAATLAQLSPGAAAALTMACST